MKVLIENKRLKANIETLKGDLNLHRSNEIQIAEILKESKTKITDLKQAVKMKSHKISIITQSNIGFKNTIHQQEQKIQQLNSYSIWQENQIRELKRELNEKCQQEIQEAILQEKINKLEGVLKSYETQFSKNYEKEQIFSRQSLEELPEEDIDKLNDKWGNNS